MAYPSRVVRRGLPRIAATLLTSLISTSTLAEGSFQIGLNQSLLDSTGSRDANYAVDDDSASLFVDILTAGEVINISLCGTTETDDLSIEVFDPNNSPVFTTTLTDSNVSCSDPMTGPLATPVRYTSTQAGTYRLVLQNLDGASFFNSLFTRYDVTVTPDAVTNPDPTEAGGRLWSFSWPFNAGTFTEVDATDADYYALVPGGRPGSNYVWVLDLNNLAGLGYSIVANAIGVDAPNSGYSTPSAGNSQRYQFPVYTNPPAIADPLPSSPPAISDVRFRDDAGVDNSISPGTADMIQDTGVFEFTSDVDGTAAIFIDTDRDGTFGDAGDALLLANINAGP
ncbi:MAG: hypothetical protein AAF610_06755, partial [Pseudomonadota bacterium]